MGSVKESIWNLQSPRPRGSRGSIEMSSSTASILSCSSSSYTSCFASSTIAAGLPGATGCSGLHWSSVPSFKDGLQQETQENSSVRTRLSQSWVSSIVGRLHQLKKKVAARSTSLDEKKLSPSESCSTCAHEGTGSNPKVCNMTKSRKRNWSHHLSTKKKTRPLMTTPSWATSARRW